MNQIESLFVTAQQGAVEFISITVTFCGHKSVQVITGPVPLEQLGVKCLVQGHNCDDSWVSSNGNQTRNLPVTRLELSGLAKAM